MQSSGLSADQLVHLSFKPLHAKLYNFNLYPFEVVSRYRDTQLQVGKKYLPNVRPSICKSERLKTHFIPSDSDLIG